MTKIIKKEFQNAYNDAESCLIGFAGKIKYFKKELEKMVDHDEMDEIEYEKTIRFMKSMLNNLAIILSRESINL